ncbi:DUF1573 domain-containing protein [Winogradskyella sp. 4-2091]|uniref:DUF1573 domain-containing protein n=1 Tax=Winogradskyella sp. 4-2091 TaxID=3381659 RepID=UPI0038922B89
MKQTLNMAFLLVFTLSFFSVAPTEFHKYDTKVAIMKFETEVINYGTIIQNSEGKRLFTFTNTGDAPLFITKVKTSCGCTVPNYSKAPIQPGDQGELEIKYDTKRLGAFTKTITVTSNAEGGNKILKIKGNIVAAK